MARSTRKSRRCQLRCYTDFCNLFRLTVFPCSPEQACLYASFLSAFMAPSSISNYLSALWSHHRGLGLDSHASDYRLQQTLKGIRRLGPFSTEEFRSKYVTLNTILPHDLVFWAAVTLAYRSLLRKCHYTPSPHSVLRVCSVLFDYRVETEISICLETQKLLSQGPLIGQHSQLSSLHIRLTQGQGVGAFVNAIFTLPVWVHS